MDKYLKNIAILLLLVLSVILSILYGTFLNPAYSAPTVDNRKPDINELPCTPQDGEITKTNPPYFIWLPQNNARKYILQVSANKDFSALYYSKVDIELNIHTPSITFIPGNYFWRYAFIDDRGSLSKFSIVRSFSIPESAAVFPIPSMEELESKIPLSHPRLFMRPEDVPKLRLMAANKLTHQWKDLRNEAEKILKKPLIKGDLEGYPGGKQDKDRKSDIDLWRKNMKISQKAVDNAATLAFCYLISGDQKYSDGARQWIMAIASWDPKGTTSYRYNDEAGMPVLHILPRAYTWAYFALTEEERLKVRTIMRIRGNEVYDYLRWRKFTSRPYESHSNRAWHFLGEAAIAFYGEIPEAKKWLEYAMSIFFSFYPVWSDDDGGWHEGILYWNAYMTRITWWIDVIKSAFGIDGMGKPFFQKVGDFPMYLSPPGAKTSGFGDNSDNFKYDRNKIIMDYFARAASNPYWQWYADSIQGREEGGYLGFLRAIMDKSKPKPPDDLPLSKLFRGTGIATLHTNLKDHTKDINLIFKASPFGSHSHGYNVQNSFLLNVYGEPLLISSGRRDWHGSRHHREWVWSSKAHNTILVDDWGQKKNSLDSRGEIKEFYTSQAYDFVSGEASIAYEGLLKKFERSIIFIKPELLIILDDIESQNPATFKWMLHSPVEMDIKDQKKIIIKNNNAGVSISFLVPERLSLKQSKGFSSPPVGFELNQWHLEAWIRDSSTTGRFITLLQPFKGQFERAVDINIKKINIGFGMELQFRDRKILGLWNLQQSGKRAAFQSLESDGIFSMVKLDNYANLVDFFIIKGSEVSFNGKRIFDFSSRTTVFKEF